MGGPQGPGGNQSQLPGTTLLPVAGAGHLKYQSSKKVTVIPAHLVSMNPNLMAAGGNAVGGGAHGNSVIASAMAPSGNNENIMTQSFNASHALNGQNGFGGGAGHDEMGAQLSSFDKRGKTKQLSIANSIDNNFLQGSGGSFGNATQPFTRNLVQSPQMLHNNGKSKLSKFDVLAAEKSLDMPADTTMQSASFQRKLQLHQSPMVKSEKKQVSRYQAILSSPQNTSGVHAGAGLN